MSAVVSPTAIPYMKHSSSQELETFRLNFALDAPAAGAPGNTFRGMASVYNTLIDAYMPTRILPGAFTRSLSDPEIKRRIKILFQHDQHKPIGIPTSMTDTTAGLLVEGRISDTQLGRECMTLLRDGVITELSIGFEPVQQIFVKDPVSGKEERHLLDLKLFEFSLVTFAANKDAKVMSVHSLLAQVPVELHAICQRFITALLETHNPNSPQTGRWIAGKGGSGGGSRPGGQGLTKATPGPKGSTIVTDRSGSGRGLVFKDAAQPAGKQWQVIYDEDGQNTKGFGSKSQAVDSVRAHVLKNPTAPPGYKEDPVRIRGDPQRRGVTGRGGQVRLRQVGGGLREEGRPRAAGAEGRERQGPARRRVAEVEQGQVRRLAGVEGVQGRDRRAEAHRRGEQGRRRRAEAPRRDCRPQDRPEPLAEPQRGRAGRPRLGGGGQGRQPHRQEVGGRVDQPHRRRGRARPRREGRRSIAERLDRELQAPRRQHPEGLLRHRGRRDRLDALAHRQQRAEGGPKAAAPKRTIADLKAANTRYRLRKRTDEQGVELEIETHDAEGDELQRGALISSVATVLDQLLQAEGYELVEEFDEDDAFDEDLEDEDPFADADEVVILDDDFDGPTDEDSEADDPPAPHVHHKFSAALRDLELLALEAGVRVDPDA